MFRVAKKEHNRKASVETRIDEPKIQQGILQSQTDDVESQKQLITEKKRPDDLDLNIYYCFW